MELAQELYDRFVAHGVTTEEVARMDLHKVGHQVRELREEPDEYPNLSCAGIALKILSYARADRTYVAAYPDVDDRQHRQEKTDEIYHWLDDGDAGEGATIDQLAIQWRVYDR